jgi:hypothetical protein
MFSRCRIAIANNSKKIEIVLLQPLGYIEKEVVTFFGKYTSDGGIPPERKGWLLAVASRELRLIDAGGSGVGMGGGGLTYGEIVAMEPFAILSEAVLTDRGIEPVFRNTAVAGQLKSGFDLNVSFNSGPVTWRLSGYIQSGSSTWVAP